MLKPQAEKSEEAKVNLKEAVKEVAQTMAEDYPPTNSEDNTSEQKEESNKTPCTCENHIREVWRRLQDMMPCIKGKTELPTLDSLPCKSGTCDSGVDLSQCSIRAIAECTPKLENCKNAVEGQRCAVFDKMTKCPHYIEEANSHAICHYKFLLYSDIQELYCGVKKDVPKSRKNCIVSRNCKPNEIQLACLPIFLKKGQNAILFSNGGRYGVRNRDKTIWSEHKGVDIGSAYGPLIRNVEDGTIMSYGLGSGGAGFRIRVKHEGYSTVYMHMAFPPTIGQLYPVGYTIALKETRESRILSEGDEFVFRILPDIKTLRFENVTIYLCSLPKLKAALDMEEKKRIPYAGCQDENPNWYKQYTPIAEHKFNFFDKERNVNYKAIIEVCKVNHFLNETQLKILEKMQNSFDCGEDFLSAAGFRKVNAYVPFYQEKDNIEGKSVKAGQIIGIMDGTSSSIRNVFAYRYGTHLHFEIFKGSEQYNPYHPLIEACTMYE